MIQNYLPALRGFVEQESEDAGGFPASFGGAVEKKSAEHRRVIRSEQLDFEIGESQRAHFFARRITLEITGQHLRVALGDGGADESGGIGFVVAVHEGGDV